MEITQKKFYYISHANDTLIIDAHINIEISISRPIPILWNNKGLFCIISRQKVKNIFDIIKDQGNLPVLNKKTVNEFHWEDGELITANVAMILLS